jgi:hypothetical protein
MNFVRSTLKVVIGLVVFASLMFLEFTSYTRAVAEGVQDEAVLNSPKAEATQLADNVKKSGKLTR